MDKKIVRFIFIDLFTALFADQYINSKMEDKRAAKNQYAIEVDTDHLVQLVRDLRVEVDTHTSKMNLPAQWAEAIVNRIDRMEQATIGTMAGGR